MEPITAIYIVSAIIVLVLVAYIIFKIVKQDKVEDLTEELENDPDIKDEDENSELYDEEEQAIIEEIYKDDSEDLLEEVNDDSDELDEFVDDGADTETADFVDDSVEPSIEDEANLIKNAINRLDPADPTHWAYFGKARQRPDIDAVEKLLGYHPDFHLMIEVWSELKSEKK